MNVPGENFKQITDKNKRPGKQIKHSDHIRIQFTVKQSHHQNDQESEQYWNSRRIPFKTLPKIALAKFK